MGIQDRDYYWENRDIDGSRKSPGKPGANASSPRTTYRTPRRAWHPIWTWILIAIATGALIRYYKDHARKPKPQPVAEHRQSPAQQKSRARAASDDEDVIVVPRFVETPVPAPQPVAKSRPAAETIYLCRRYSGGEFWSNGICSNQSALIIRMTTVPGNLSFEQQVAMAQSQKTEAEALVRRQTASTASSANIQTTRNACAALESRIEHLDALARQPQTARMQDSLRKRRQDTRDRLFRLNC